MGETGIERGNMGWLVPLWEVGPQMQTHFKKPLCSSLKVPSALVGKGNATLLSIVKIKESVEARLKTTKEILTRGVKVVKGRPKDLVVIESAGKEGASTGTGRGIGGAGTRAQKSSTRT